jgi:hypothetical protein
MKPASVAISAPKFQMAVFEIVGQSPYVQHKFSEKARKVMKDSQEAGQAARNTGRKRAPKDFDAAYKGAMHISEEGWNGIPAPAFRCAMIDACRLTGAKMTMAKMSVFVVADGFDADDGTPMVKLIGKPEPVETTVRLATGVPDIRVRPMWRKWSAKVTIRWDADQFTIEDVTNLLQRAGLQVGIGEGRPFSKQSNGQGWGLFDIRTTK